LNQNRALIFCFDAFSPREPVPTSLENALAMRGRVDGIDVVGIDAPALT